MEQQVPYPEEVKILAVGKRQFIIVGTAHISRRSAELVRQVIEAEKPDVVAVELDAQRYQSLSDQEGWKKLDLRQVIRKKRLSLLVVNLVLASYQKRLGDQLGVAPGSELLEAVLAAEEGKIPFAFCDRDVRITLRRAWHSMSLWEKLKLLSSGLGGEDEGNEVSEEALERLKESDVLSELMGQIGETLPTLKGVLIDERDQYLAEKMRQVDGERVVAVVGAGHLQGVCAALEQELPVDLAALEVIPPVSRWLKVLGWAIPLAIIASIAYIGQTKGLAAAGDNILFWLLANGIPSGVGALIALGHPLTILAATCAAPFTSLSPLIGAGYVAAFVQVWVAPPVVGEIQQVTGDAGEMRKWWSNKVLRVLLVFILTSLGSALGTYVGAYKIFTSLF